MNRLPQETIDHIVSFLPSGPDRSLFGKRPPRAQYATVSNKFRAVIERSTFKSIWINSDELETFAQYLKFNRQGILRRLNYTILLPAIDTAVLERFERPYETEVVSKQFSHCMKELFDTLHRMNGLSGIELCFADVAHLPVLSDEEIWARGLGDTGELRSDRYMRTRINLLNPDALPQLKCISRLSLGECDRGHALGVQVDLAARMPGLKAISIYVSGYEFRYPGLLRQDRHNLAAALKLRSEETATISEAILNMSVGNDKFDQLLPMPNLTFPTGCDPLGSSVRCWSQRLTKFWLTGVIDGTFFWPHALETETTPLEWPNLEIIRVSVERHTPSGWWYFMPQGNPKYGTPPRNPAEDPNDLPQPLTDNPTDGDESIDRDEETYWDYCRIHNGSLNRNVPNEDTMQPLLAAWARALQSMPSLRQATLIFRIKILLSGADIEGKFCRDGWEVTYESPDFNITSWWEKLDYEKRTSRRLIFHNTGGWRPNNDTMDLLRRTGEYSHPETKLVVLAIDEWGNIVGEESKSQPKTFHSCG